MPTLGSARSRLNSFFWRLYTPRNSRRRSTKFLLDELDHSPFRFRVNSERRSHESLTGAEADIVQYIKQHPGATIDSTKVALEAASGTPIPYNDIRGAVSSLTKRGVLRITGRAPLEEVDDRYERVATCDVCGEPTRGHKLVLWKYNTPVVRCTGCGVLYANPRWKAEHLFGRYTPDFWDTYAAMIEHKAPDIEANNARWANYLGMIEGSRVNNRVLDVGCATGEFLFAAKAQGWEVYGIEPSPPAAHRAHELTGGTIHAGTLATAEFPEGYFDAITLWDVIEHLQSPSEYIEQIARRLRKGGTLSITTPNIKSVSFLLLGADWTPVGPNDHIYYFSPRTLTRLLEQQGFAVYAMSTVATEPATWEAALKVPALARYAPRFVSASLPITNRFLLGDELYVVARRKD